MQHTSFTDSSGVAWIVREDGGDESRSGTHTEQIPGTVWLRFESDLEVRRLWHYPDDWRGLSPIQLEALLDRASTVIARFRPVPQRRAIADTDLRRPAAPAPPAIGPRKPQAEKSGPRWRPAGSRDDSDSR